MTLELDGDRLAELKNVLPVWEKKNQAMLKDVQRLVGILSFASSCIRQGHPFFSRIINFLREMPKTGSVRIPVEVKKDINW